MPLTLLFVTSFLCLVAPGWTTVKPDEHYRQYPKHTMTLYKKFGKNCDVDKSNREVLRSGPVNDTEKASFLKFHNDLRRKVAKGLEQRGKPGPQPQAADMMEMTWDDELAAIAQRWAEQCPSGNKPHDENRRTDRWGWVGQNMFKFNNQTTSLSQQPDLPATADAEIATRYWYMEVSDFNKSHIAPFQFTSPTGHYTQLVWGNSGKLGCGFVMMKEENQGSFYKMYTWENYIICNYGPGGNINGLKMYTLGTAGSKCPAGTRNNDGLCSSLSSDRSSSQNTVTPTSIWNRTRSYPSTSFAQTPTVINQDNTRTSLPTSEEKGCSTTSGEVCVFPFYYRGRTYKACTKRNFNKWWCATRVDDQGSFIRTQWGICEDDCEKTKDTKPGQQVATASKMKKFMDLINSLSPENREILKDILKLLFILISS